MQVPRNVCILIQTHIFTKPSTSSYTQKSIFYYNTKYKVIYIQLFDALGEIKKGDNTDGSTYYQQFSTFQTTVQIKQHVNACNIIIANTTVQ